MSGPFLRLVPTLRRLVLAGFFAFIALVLAAAVTGNNTLITLAGLLGSLIPFLGQAAESLGAARRRSDRTAHDLAQELADILNRVYATETEVRGLVDDPIVPIEWRESEREVADPETPRLVGKTADAKATRAVGRMSGDLQAASAKLVEAFGRVSTGRLAILGEPGSGKSALALILATGLITSRRAGGRVAVLLPASTWDPSPMSMNDWVVDWMAKSYYGGRREVPRKLLAEGLLLPVVDGLDEIPEAQRRTAIKAMNEAIRDGDPIVVTCRAVEFEDLIEAGSPRLKRALVIEVRPVQPKDAEAYLTHVDLPDVLSWTPLIQTLEAKPRPPAAEALTTPLMLSLTRLVMSRLAIDPRVLVDATRFESRHGVEDFITEQVIEAAYAPKPTSGANPDVADSRWSADEARRWLTYLADYLHAHNERDLHWWLLSPRLLSRWFGPAIGILLGLLTIVGVAGWAALGRAWDGSVPLALSTTIIVSASAGVGAAVLSIIVWYAAEPRSPGRFDISTENLIPRLGSGFRNGSAAVLVPGATFTVGLLIVITISHAWTMRNVQLFFELAACTATAAAAVGVALGVYTWSSHTPLSAVSGEPGELLRNDRRAAWACALLSGLALAVITPFALLIGAFTGTVAYKLAANWSGWPDRNEFVDLAQASWNNVTIGAFRSAWLAVGGSVVLPGVAIAVLILLTRAWPRFVLVRAFLAARKELPWDLLAFLQDAHQRNVLRQVGSGYQFRHIRLQEHLGTSAKYRTPATAPRLTRRQMTYRVATVAAVLIGGLAIVVAVPDSTSARTLQAPHGFHITSVRMSPDGRTLAAVGRDSKLVLLWDAVTGEKLPSLKAVHPVETVSFSPKGRFVIASRSQYIGEDYVEQDSAWQLSNGAPVAQDVSWCRFTRDDRYLEINQHLGDVASSAYRTTIKDTLDSQTWFTGTNVDIAVYSRSLMLLRTSGKTVEARSVPQGKLLYSFPDETPRDDPSTFWIRHGMLFESTGDDEQLTWRDLKTGAELGSTTRDEDVFVDLTSDDSRAVILEVSRGELVGLAVKGIRDSSLDWERSIDFGGLQTDAIYYLVNDRILQVGDVEEDGETWLIDVNTGAPLRHFSQPKYATLDVALSRDGRDAWALGGKASDEEADTEASMEITDVFTGKSIGTIAVHPDAIFNATDDGTDRSDNGESRLLKRPDGSIALVQLRNASIEWSLSAGTDNSAGFTADGDFIFAIGTSSEIVDTSSWHAVPLPVLPVQVGFDTAYDSQNVKVQPGTGALDDQHTNLFSPGRKGKIVVSSDSHYLIALAPKSERVQLVDLRTGHSRDLVGTRGRIKAFGFSRDEKTVIAVGSDDTIRLWPL